MTSLQFRRWTISSVQRSTLVFRARNRLYPAKFTGYVLVVLGGLCYLSRPSQVLHADDQPPQSRLLPASIRDVDGERTLGRSKRSQPTLWRRICNAWALYLWEPLLTARRFCYLVFLFGPVILTSPLLLVGKVPLTHGNEPRVAIWWYIFLTKQMERAGPAFVKLAQWAGSRTDLFPSALCERFGALHSRGKPHSFRHTRSVIEHSFQRPLDDIFEELHEEPIGVGAIGQVYKARIRKDVIPPSHLGPKRTVTAHLPIPYPLPPSLPTRDVAIKVLHPRVDVMISRDLSIMKFFARVLTLLPGMRWISLPEEVEVFGSMMHSQIDLRNEAENLMVFESNFKTRKAAVTFPRPLRMWTSKDILIEEHQEALPLEYFLGHKDGAFNEQIAQIGLDAFLHMLLIDNFVHSDLHPGNIMIKFYKPSVRFIMKGIWSTIFHTPPPDTAIDFAESDQLVKRLRSISKEDRRWNEELQRLADEGYQPEIVFIDAGLVNQLGGKNRQNFLELFASIAQFDGYKAGTLMVERCRTPDLAIDPETFALKIQHIVLRVKKESFSLGRITISDVLKDVLRAVREHHVKMEGDFINTVISVLLLEGIGRTLDPNLDLFRSSLPILRRLGREMASQDTMTQMDISKVGPLLKFWFWAEARSLATTAFLHPDTLVEYDLIAPNV